MFHCVCVETGGPKAFMLMLRGPAVIFLTQLSDVLLSTIVECN